MMAIGMRTKKNEDLLGTRSNYNPGGTLNSLLERVQATNLTSSALHALQQAENIHLQFLLPFLNGIILVISIIYNI